jgi:hypothetical protein
MGVVQAYRVRILEVGCVTGYCCLVVCDISNIFDFSIFKFKFDVVVFFPAVTHTWWLLLSSFLL